jgi:hypothetical protein
MTKANFIHDPVDGSLTRNLESFRFLKEKCLIHANTPIGIITFILCIDCSHSISEILIFPGAIFMSKIFVEPLAANAKHPAIE